MLKVREIILVIVILILAPFTIFAYAVSFASVQNQAETNQTLKEEICRLNKIIEDLKGNQRACWIPTTPTIEKIRSTP